MNRSARRSAAKRHRSDRNADARPPMLVCRGIRNDEIEVRERMAVEAFALGFADADHFDTLCAMQGVLILAGSTSDKRAPAMHYARNVLGKAMEAIRARHTETGKLDCTAEELAVLRGFVSMYRDFWLRAPVSLYEAACAELQRFHERIASERVASNEKGHERTDSVAGRPSPASDCYATEREEANGQRRTERNR